MEKLRIIVLCGGKTAFESINLLALEGHLAGTLIGGSDKKTAQILEQFSEGSNIPFLSITSKKEIFQLENWIQGIQPDYIFVINFPFLISSSLLELFPNKWFNFHMGPLPKYRGAMPIFEVIKAGETETAIAIHKMTVEADEGPIVFQEPVTIDFNETFGSLAIKLRERTCLVVQSFIQMIQFGTTIPLLPQNEEEAEYFPMPELEETRIIWENMEAGKIVQLINACNPWNDGADVMFTIPFKIIAAIDLKQFHGQEAGTVISIDHFSTKIACINNTILIVQIIKLESGIHLGCELKKIQIQIGSSLNQ